MIYFPAPYYKSKHQIARALNRSARYGRCEEGNRNPFLNSRTYYAAIKSDDAAVKEAAALVRNAKGERPITDKEITYVIKKNQKLVNRRWLECGAEASRLLGPGWHINAYMVLQQMLLFAYKTGICSAAQGEIGKAIGMSRKSVNQWVKRFRESGIVKLIGYDCRGVAMNTYGKPILWRGQPVLKYCLILAIVGPTAVTADRYTTPIQAESVAAFSLRQSVLMLILTVLLPWMLSKIARARRFFIRHRHRWVHSKRF